MFIRKLYLDRIIPYIGQPMIKVITGMRRVGKSTFLLQIMDYLKTEKRISDRQIIFINKDSLEFDAVRDYKDFYRYVKEKIGKSKKFYLFVDEIQEIRQWEKTLTSLIADYKNSDIYITGSNAHLLSSELSTFLSGRYIRFPIYSLGAKEIMEFHGEPMTAQKAFDDYLKFGGLPAIFERQPEESIAYPYLADVYDSILLKDVVARYGVKNVETLKNITRFIFDNIGHILSSKKVADYLKSQKIAIGVETVQNYLFYLCSAYALHKVSRFDIRGKRMLEMHEKYFLGDIGLRHALLGYKEGDISGILENIVFLEFLRRGYQISIGKIKEFEVDFIAEKGKKKLYIQVCYLLATHEIIERELRPLRLIKDNYPKFLLTLDTKQGGDFDGIRRLNLIDFLMDPNLTN